jgi:hypothetical protein
MWTYQQIADALQVHKRTVVERIARLKIPTYRKPQQNERYVPESGVARLMTAYLIKCKAMKLRTNRGNRWNGNSQAERSEG